MAVENQMSPEASPVDPSALAWAEYWYSIAWKGLLWAGVITAVGAFATMAFLMIQWRSTIIRDQQTEWRTASLELQTASAKVDLEKAKTEIANANRETAIARLEAERIRQRLVWRIIDSGPQERIAGALRKFSPQKFSLVLYRADDPEASNLHDSIRLTLEAAGWEYAIVPQKPPLAQEGVWLEWANSSGGQIAGAKDALAIALKDNANVAPTLFSSSEKFEGFGPLIVIGVGKKPPSPMEPSGPPSPETAPK